MDTPPEECEIYSFAAKGSWSVDLCETRWYCSQVASQSRSVVALDSVDLGPLIPCATVTVGYHTCYGQSVWHIMYQAGTRIRCRSRKRSPK